jgi:hypothetical protein
VHAAASTVATFRGWTSQPGRPGNKVDNGRWVLEPLDSRYRLFMATAGGIAIPRFVVWLIWVVLIALLVILLAWIIHRAGGGTFNVKLGHFSMQIGVS